jgi:hypothetical protein
MDAGFSKEGAMTVGRGRQLLVTAVSGALVFSSSIRAQPIGLMYRWPTRDGHFFEAALLRLQGNAVVFARDGWEFTVPISTLSSKSLELARRQAMRVPAAIPAIPATPLAPIASFSCNSSILEFCRDNVGRKIGSGQCAMLAQEALKSAGAEPRGGDSPGEGDYVWGELVATIKAGFYGASGVKDLAYVQPGDIIQFHDVRFSGYLHGDYGVYHMEARHHTAVLESVDAAHNTITVLHQNWNGQKTIRRQTLYLGGMNRGWLRFYRPSAVAQPGGFPPYYIRRG